MKEPVFLRAEAEGAAKEEAQSRFLRAPCSGGGLRRTLYLRIR